MLFPRQRVSERRRNSIAHNDNDGAYRSMRVISSITDAEINLGFTTETDLFLRADLANRLTNLFVGLEHGSVCLLDGRWGVGKTVFVRQWAVELCKRGIPSIYFDAFAADYVESPFQAVAGSFVKAATDARRTSDPIYQNFLNRAARVGKAVAATGAKLGVKAATLGLISNSEVEQLSGIRDAFIEGAGEITEEGVKRLLESNASAEADFTALRESLSSLPELLRPVLTEATTGTDGDPTASEEVPLIVIIDELDRCRPDFALGVMEVLKHFFRSEGIHFVVVTNRDHLELAITHRYGLGAGATEYLEKFYDFVVYFEQANEQYDPAGIGRFAAYVTERVLPATGAGVQEVKENIQELCKAFRLSPRQVERFATNVALSFLAAREREFRPAILVSILAAIKTLRPDLYRKAKLGLLTHEEVASFLDKKLWSHFDPAHVTKVFRFYLDPDIDVNAEEWQGFGRSLWNYNIDRTRVVPYLVNSILDRFAG